jgi:chemotaxis family two-component system response regulator Rcp1
MRSGDDVVDVLLVEDNAGDVRLTRELLRDAAVRTRLSVVGDGDEALDYMYRRGRHAKATRPDLILLDLNLPSTSGLEVLATVKADPELKRIPIIVLTTSSAAQDIARSYDLHANSYLVKPVGLDQFASVVGSIERFWLSTVELPPRCAV